MKKNTKIHLLHFGPGMVGRAFLRQMLENKKTIERAYAIQLKMIGIFKSDSYLFAGAGLPRLLIQKIIDQELSRHAPWKQYEQNSIKDLIRSCEKPAILIDSTASDKMSDILLYGLQRDCFVVMANKKPLTSTYQRFKTLQQFKHQLYCETTVGSGLPIISTIQKLIDTGDEIIQIQACFSGTLGFICSLLQEGIPFSSAVLKAKESGFTEPDPRDDLSGIDVARKALIIARLIGYRISLDDIDAQPLYPKKFRSFSVDEFLYRLPELDESYRIMTEKTMHTNKTLRYILEIKEKTIRIQLKEVLLESDIGNLKGPDNIVVIQTKRYNKNPLVIKGPGAGTEVAAAGILGDVIRSINAITGGK